MRTHILILLVGFALNGIGQDSTRFLLSSKPLKVRLQASIGYEGSFINRAVVHSSGLDLGILFNKRFYLGGYIFSGINSAENVVLTNPFIEKSSISLSALGFRTGYHFRPYKAIHLATNTQIGSLTFFANTADGDFQITTTLVFTPSFETELNLTRYFKLGIGLGYRFTDKKDLFFTQNEVKNIVYNITVRFGRFGR